MDEDPGVGPIRDLNELTIIGADGQLGSDLSSEFKRRGIRLTGLVKNDIDISDA